MQWTDFAIEANEQVAEAIYIMAMILYSIIFLATVTAVFSIRRKFSRTKTMHKAINSIYGIYIAASFYAINGFVIRLTLYFSNGQYALLYLSRAFIYGAGYGIEIISLYILAVNVLSLSRGYKKNIRTMSFGVLSISIIGAFFTFIANFISLDIHFEILMTMILIGLGLIPMFAFAVVLFIESKRNANIMGRLRLRLMGIGLSLTLLDLLTNGITYVLKYLDSPLLLSWHQIFIPIFSCMVNLGIVISFYYSLFPPVWLQRVMGIMPPSFYTLIKKQRKGHKEVR